MSITRLLIQGWCKLTDEIINVKGSDVQIDHVNGDRTDNGVENFSAVKDWANAMKADAKSYDMLEKRLETVLKTIRKYKWHFIMD